MAKKKALLMDVCFFCGKDKGLLAVELKKGAELPNNLVNDPRVVVGYEPCDECAAQTAKGVTLVECVDESTGMQPIQDKCWPTGRWCVVTQEAADRMFGKVNTTRKKLLIDRDLYSEFFGKDARPS